MVQSYTSKRERVRVCASELPALTPSIAAQASLASLLCTTSLPARGCQGIHICTQADGKQQEQSAGPPVTRVSRKMRFIRGWLLASASLNWSRMFWGSATPLFSRMILQTAGATGQWLPSLCPAPAPPPAPCPRPPPLQPRHGPTPVVRNAPLVRKLQKVLEAAKQLVGNAAGGKMMQDGRHGWAGGRVQGCDAFAAPSGRPPPPFPTSQSLAALLNASCTTSCVPNQAWPHHLQQAQPTGYRCTLSTRLSTHRGMQRAPAAGAAVGQLDRVGQVSGGGCALARTCSQGDVQRRDVAAGGVEVGILGV